MGVGFKQGFGLGGKEEQWWCWDLRGWGGSS